MESMAASDCRDEVARERIRALGERHNDFRDEVRTDLDRVIESARRDREANLETLRLMRNIGLAAILRDPKVIVAIVTAITVIVAGAFGITQI